MCARSGRKRTRHPRLGFMGSEIDDMTNNAPAPAKKAAYLNVPWEEAYGYAQAVQVGRTIYLSGQLSHDAAGALIAPASLNDQGAPKDFTQMEAQMAASYANATTLLAQVGATLDNVVEETLFVLDVEAAFAVAGRVRRKAYGVAKPLVASNLIGVSRLAFAEQLIEITFRAELPPE
jgi:enamine deaminase RidA (YjgF/YER057c/UK114 family)